jgi:hypothetical protein
MIDEHIISIEFGSNSFDLQLVTLTQKHVF